MSRQFNPIFLRMRAEGKPRAEIAEALGIKISTLSDYVTDFKKWGFLAPVFVRGGKKSPSGRIELLKELWAAGMHVDDVAKQLGTTRSSVESLVAYHGLHRDQRVTAPRFWTPERKEQLRVMWKRGDSDEKIGQFFGKPAKTINRARRGFLKADGTRYVAPNAWTEAETAELTRLWTVVKLNPAEIGRRMNKTRNQIESKAVRLKLPRNVALRIIKAPANRSYDNVAASNRARAGTTMRPRPKAGPKEDSNVIPMTARPWLTRERGKCNYPFGERGNIHSCCQPVWNGGTLCESHNALCFDHSRQYRKVG